MRYKRETLQDMTRPLKQWLYKNKNNPYPSKRQKFDLADESHMTLTQISNWFANARRRLKNTVKGQELSWEKRVKMYDGCIKGHQEALNMDSEDSAWESGDEEMRANMDLQCMEQPDLLKDTENRSQDLLTSDDIHNPTEDPTCHENDVKPDVLKLGDSAAAAVPVLPKSVESQVLPRSHLADAATVPVPPFASQPQQPLFWPTLATNQEPSATSNVSYTSHPGQTHPMAFLPQNLLPAPIMQSTVTNNNLSSPNQIAEGSRLNKMTDEEASEIKDELLLKNNNNLIAVDPNNTTVKKEELSSAPTFPDQNNATSSLAMQIAQQSQASSMMPPFMLGMNSVASDLPTATPVGLLSPLAAHIYSYLIQCEQIKNAGGVPTGLDVSKLLPLVSAIPQPNIALPPATTEVATNARSTLTPSCTPEIVAMPTDLRNRDLCSPDTNLTTSSITIPNTAPPPFCPTFAQSTPTHTNIAPEQQQPHHQYRQEEKMDLHQHLPCRQCSATNNNTTSCHSGSLDTDATTSHHLRLTESPSTSDYPKSETPKYKNTLLQRYLHGNLEDKFDPRKKYSDLENDVAMSMAAANYNTNDDSGIQTTPNTSASSASGPLDLSKRIRNLSGSVGSQEYENISEADVSSIEMSSHGGVSVSTYTTGCVSPSQTWNTSNTAPETMETQHEPVSEEDDLAMKEMCAIFTLANLARSRSTHQSLPS